MYTIPNMNAMCASIFAPQLALASGLSIASMGLLVLAYRRIRGTTLVAPWGWSVTSLGSILVAEVVIAASGNSGPLLRYCAAVTTVCPAMALLGAKRPQDVGWQFVVISLWIVLFLPAAQTAMFWRGGEFALTWAWSWFLMTLIIVGVSNHLPTRHGGSAALLAVGQWFLLREHLPLARGPSGATGVTIALFLMLLAIALAFFRILLRKKTKPGIDKVWLDFRDAYGAVWGLRMIERVNATAKVAGWNLQLGWHGFRGQDSDHPETEAELSRTLRTLLRRFVSPEWINERVESQTTPGQERRSDAMSGDNRQ